MGTLRRLFGFLAMLMVILGAAWFFRNDIERWLSGTGGEEVAMQAPSPEAAARVETVIGELLQGGGAAETRLTELELQSYVAYLLAERLPAGVESPAVELRDSTIAFSAGVDFTRLEVGGEAAAGLGRMFGDSARIAGELFPQVGAAGEGRLHLLSLQAGVLPVPPPLLGLAAEQVGLRADGRTVLFDIPRELTGIRIETGELILLMDR